MDDIEFWQPSFSQRETSVFKDRHIQGTDIRAPSVSGNAIFARLDDWDETLQALDVVQVMDMTASDEVDLAARQVERDIDTEQLDFLQVRRQSAEFRYPRGLVFICGYDGQEELLDSSNLRSGGSQGK